MVSNLKVRSVLVCDDARAEANGKQLCIGIYNGLIKIDRLPTLLPKLAVRVEFEGLDAGKFPLFISIGVGKKNELIGMNGELEINENNEPAAVIVNFSPVLFREFGMYVVRFGLTERPPIVYRFRVQSA